MSCWQFSMTHCHHCICIIVLYQVLVRNIISIKQPPAWKLSQQMFLLVLSILNHLTELLELITKCSHLIFYWPLTNVHLLFTPIIDTIYLDKFVLNILKTKLSFFLHYSITTGSRFHWKQSWEERLNHSWFMYDMKVTIITDSFDMAILKAQSLNQNRFFYLSDPTVETWNNLFANTVVAVYYS